MFCHNASNKSYQRLQRDISKILIWRFRSYEIFYLCLRQLSWPFRKICEHEHNCYFSQYTGLASVAERFGVTC